MNDTNVALAQGLVRAGYIRQGAQGIAARQKLVTTLLSERRLPADGWDEASIELLVHDAALMDSNNFMANVGLGEREARVVCPLVSRRHYGLAHGVGRSGDITAEQPKAAGSTLLAKLCNLLAADALKVAGLQELVDVTVLPVATGMAMTLTLLALRKRRPATARCVSWFPLGQVTSSHSAHVCCSPRYVVWPRCDQKTCVKAVLAAGLDLLVVENVLEGDQLRTDVDAVRGVINDVGPDAVVCVLSTSSCFAPRAADKLLELAQLCATVGVGHVVNNAYGVQAHSLSKAICAACRRGRVDAVVQSTDKNLLVPVGGAIVAAPRAKEETASLVTAINQDYPGRACMAPLLDVLMTLLYMGRSGWQTTLHARSEGYTYLRDKLGEVATLHGERLLVTPDNPISMGMTLCSLSRDGVDDDVAFFGSMLFARCVSGTRTVPRGRTQQVGGIAFKGYGAHHNRCVPGVVAHVKHNSAARPNHSHVPNLCSSPPATQCHTSPQPHRWA